MAVVEDLKPFITVERITRITFAPGLYTVPGTIEVDDEGQLTFEGWRFEGATLPPPAAE